MVQESTLICVDNSEWMRNGDMSPNRLQCQQEAIRVLVQFKLRSNPENAVGLISMANNIKILASLTQEDRKLMARLHQVEIEGCSKIMRAIKTAHLVLKNRSNRNHKTRIVVFIGSPLDNLESDYGENEFNRLAKKLKKENVKVDFVLFGEATSVKNQTILDFVDIINGPDGVGSNVVVVPGDAKLFEALLSSTICRNEDGTSGGELDFGIDGDDDPELALALRVSLEEQRQRQRQEVNNVAPIEEASVEPMDVDKTNSDENSQNVDKLSTPLKIDGLDPAIMSEEEQIQWALRMSMMTDLEEKSSEKNTSFSNAVSTDTSSEGNLLQPVSSYSNESKIEGIKVDDEVLSSAGATASGTPAPTPMETNNGEKNDQYSEALGQLMDNPDLLQQLVDQIPDSKVVKKTDGKN